MLQVFIGQLCRWNKILCEEENFMKWKSVWNEIHESFRHCFSCEISAKHCWNHRKKVFESWKKFKKNSFNMIENHHLIIDILIRQFLLFFFISFHHSAKFDENKKSMQLSGLAEKFMRLRCLKEFNLEAYEKNFLFVNRFLFLFFLLKNEAPPSLLFSLFSSELAKYEAKCESI